MGLSGPTRWRLLYLNLAAAKSSSGQLPLFQPQLPRVSLGHTKHRAKAPLMDDSSLIDRSYIHLMQLEISNVISAASAQSWK
jgi:hypothetical protein